MAGLDYSRRLGSVAEQDISTDVAVLDITLLEVRREPQWSLGVTASSELRLFLDSSPATTDRKQW